MIWPNVRRVPVQGYRARRRCLRRRQVLGRTRDRVDGLEINLAAASELLPAASELVGRRLRIVGRHLRIAARRPRIAGRHLRIAGRHLRIAAQGQTCCL